MRISDWSSDVCSSDLHRLHRRCSRAGDGHAAGALRRHSVEHVRHIARRMERDPFPQRRRSDPMVDHEAPVTTPLPDTASMLPVDQAGEYGATRIYAGQLAVMGARHPEARVIRRMARQEERHREILDKLLAERGVRPTAMQPLWDVAGLALGAATALMGPRADRACQAPGENERA